jgi:DegV family protein with EDD domain
MEGNTMSFRIVADSSCDIFQLEGIDFTSVPLKISTDNREYIDDEHLNIENMINELKEHKGRSYTSCPNASEWERAFGDDEYVFAVTITSRLSGSYNSAVMAKQACEEKNPSQRIKVIDSLSTGPEMVLILNRLRELILRGETFDDICNDIDEYQKKTHLLFALESMHNLVQNGRVSKLVAAAVDVLGIRVVGMAGEEGTLDIVKKSRGVGKTITTFVKELKQLGYSGGKVNISHCLNKEGAQKLKDAIISEFKDAAVNIYPARGLCSYYAEKGGILMGFEC